MADQKVSDLPSLNGADVDAADLLYIVDSSAGTAGSKKITVGQYQLAPYSAGTANGVMYLNGSNVVTTGSGLTFDGTNLGIGVTPTERLDVNGSAKFGATISTGAGVSTGDVNLELGGFRTGNGPSFIDFHSVASTDYESRIIRQSGANGRLEFQNSGTGEMWLLQTGASSIIFFTNNTDRARITSGGDLLVGTTTSFPGAGGGNIDGAMIETTGTGFFSRSGGFDALFVNRGNDGTVVTINRAAVTVGSISVSGSSTAYNTSSDYRLKDNQQPLTGSGAFIDALQPKTWNWKADGSRGVGFIAHEAKAVSPTSVIGEKDAVDADGKPVMQAMEYGSAEFIANIVAELQSLRARVAALEAQ